MNRPCYIFLFFLMTFPFSIMGNDGNPVQPITESMASNLAESLLKQKFPGREYFYTRLTGKDDAWECSWYKDSGCVYKYPGNIIIDKNKGIIRNYEIPEHDINEGKLAIQKGDSKKALELFEKCTKMETKEAKMLGYFYVGFYYSNIPDRLSQAAKAFDSIDFKILDKTFRFIERSYLPDNYKSYADIYFIAGETYRLNKELDKAAKSYKLGIEKYEKEIEDIKFHFETNDAPNEKFDKEMRDLEAYCSKKLANSKMALSLTEGEKLRSSQK